MTAMVGEFPELQGTMGRYYAEAEGLPRECVAGARGALSAALCRRRVAVRREPAKRSRLADKIDTLVGIFAIEQRPTGAKDPFGLRRAALGVLRILLEARLDLDLFEVLAAAAAAQPLQRAGVADEVYDFIAERLRGLLLEEPGTTRRCSTRCSANRPRSPLDAVTRLAALKEFLLLPDAGVLAGHQQAHRQHSEEDAGAGRYGSSILRARREEAERGLHHALTELARSCARCDPAAPLCRQSAGLGGPAGAGE